MGTFPSLTFKELGVGKQVKSTVKNKMFADKTEWTMFVRPLSIYFHSQYKLLGWNFLSNVSMHFKPIFWTVFMHGIYWISTTALTNIPQPFHLLREETLREGR